MAHPPDVNPVVTLDVEGEVLKPRKGPNPQLRDVEVVGEAQQAVVRVATDVIDGALDRLDESFGGTAWCAGDQLVDGGLNVIGGEPAQPDWLEVALTPRPRLARGPKCPPPKSIETAPKKPGWSPGWSPRAEDLAVADP